MAGGREVGTEERGRMAMVREIVWGSMALRRRDTTGVEEGTVASASSADRIRSPARWWLSGPAEGGRREGLGPRASMPAVAGVVPATRRLIAAPWTPASLSLLPAGSG